MTPEQYDAWYDTPRGRWIGETEYRLLIALLGPPPNARILDVGCGSGWFTRRLARDGYRVTGIDVDAAVIAYARAHRAAAEDYLVADAAALPFVSRAFDCCVSVTAVCFLREEARALAEMLRVARGRVALGLLNRHSLLYLQKGRGGGKGAYRGARWHRASEARALLCAAGAREIEVRSAVFLASGGAAARRLEGLLSTRIPAGGFLAASAAVPASRHDR
jgi:SAM-dependent methyltransferase